MKKHNFILFIIASTLLLTSCGNDVEEIKNPSTGKLLKRYEYYTDDSGQKIKDGEYFEWDASGNKIAALHYQDDSLNGSCIYYKDGTITSYNYSMGRVDGERSIKTTGGNWVLKENYKDGILNGVQSYYHSSGKIQCSGNYALGKQTGIWKYFDDNGKPAFNLTFKNGVCQELIGTWILKDDGITTFIFRKNGTFTLKAPYFRYSRQASVQGEGPFSVTNTLEMTHKNGALSWEYEVFDVEKNRLILINPNTEIENSIVDLNRAKN